MSKGKEVMDQIADTIIKSIEQGLADGHWQKPWVTRKQPMGGLPINAITRKAYTGGNVFYLWMMGFSYEYTSNEWGTYKQWESVEAQVRKGEKGIQTVRWNVIVCKDHGKDVSCTRCGRMVPNVFTLFNANQVDGYTPKDVVVVDEDHVNPGERVEKADAFFSQIEANVTYGHPYAAFNPRTDAIMMPAFDDFVNAEAFYGTLAHEFIHWTGAENRLGRDLTVARDSDDYALEELVAEMGSAMLCGILGLEETPRPDHAVYLASWVRRLREDNRALWKAASQATKAVEFLEGLVAYDPQLVYA